MSLINQVLNDLERRGVQAPLGEQAIRAVPLRERSPQSLYGVLFGMLLVGAVWGGWTWYERREPVASAPMQPAAVEVVEQVHGKPLLKVEPEAAAEVVSETTATPSPRASVPRPAPAPRANTLPVRPSQSEPARIATLKTVTPRQQAEHEFTLAEQALHEGRSSDALAGYEAALLIDPYFKSARLGWVGELLRLKRNAEAEQVLQRGLRRDPRDTEFAMLLARVQVERDAVPLALNTLENGLPYAAGQAEYHGFMAALFQRQARHKEAVAYFQMALQKTPSNSVWWMGLGMSLQALERNDEARHAYQQALANQSLSPPLQQFVQDKLKAL